MAVRQTSKAGRRKEGQNMESDWFFDLGAVLRRKGLT